MELRRCCSLELADGSETRITARTFDGSGAEVGAVVGLLVDGPVATYAAHGQRGLSCFDFGSAQELVATAHTDLVPRLSEARGTICEAGGKVPV